MKILSRLVVAIAAVAGLMPAGAGAAETTTLRIGVCSKTLSAGLIAPFAVASKMGWFSQEGLKIEVVPLPGAADCVKYLASKELPITQPSIEPLAILKPQGVKAKMFYTVYQNNTYGLAVPEDSPIRQVSDLKGKRIGVISMSSGGFVIARAMAAMAGLDPDRDIKIVVAGEGAQPAALIRQGSIDALSQFDTQYAMIENAGIKIRRLDNSAISRFPSNGLMALDETLAAMPEQIGALGRAIAKGEVFAMANPEATIRIIYDAYPQTRPTGKDDATAIVEDVRVLKARMDNWRLDRAGVTKWGENSAENYNNYLAFLLKWGIIKEPVSAEDVTTNKFVDAFNKFDQPAIEQAAKAYK